MWGLTGFSILAKMYLRAEKKTAIKKKNIRIINDNIHLKYNLSIDRDERVKFFHWDVESPIENSRASGFFVSAKNIFEH